MVDFELIISYDILTTSKIYFLVVRLIKDVRRCQEIALFEVDFEQQELQHHRSSRNTSFKEAVLQR